MSAKFGLVGLMKCLALELGEHGIRVNSVNPTTVDTKMVIDEQTMRHFLPDQDEPDMEDFKALMREPHILPVPWVESIDVSNAVLYLACDESRYVTGVALPMNGAGGAAAGPCGDRAAARSSASRATTTAGSTTCSWRRAPGDPKPATAGQLDDRRCRSSSCCRGTTSRPWRPRSSVTATRWPR